MSEISSDVRERRRLRLRIARHGAAAGLSQQEQLHAFREMALSSGLPCLITGKGMPRMSFGPAVSAGYESEAEYADIYLAAPVDRGQAAAKISAVALDGFSVLDVRKVPVHFPSLESLLNVACYELSGEFGTQAPQLLEKLLARETITVARKKQDGTDACVDVRPLIISMALAAPQTLRLLLRFGPGRNVKPELLAGEWLGREVQVAVPGGFRVLRKQFYWEGATGELHEP